MPTTEAMLKRQLQEDTLAPLYVFYGEEGYLCAHYAERVAAKAVGKDACAAFNLQKLDGQTCTIEQLEDAAETLPLMAERKCVVVRDYDVAAAGADAHERLMALVSQPPQETVLVFWMDAVEVDSKKNARWRTFLSAAEKTGVCVAFPRKTEADIVRLLCMGATRRGSRLSPDNARKLLEQCGNDLNLLLNELDKLCAIAGEAEIIREHIEMAATPNLDASMYHLSKALLQSNYARAYGLLDKLFAQRVKAVPILAALSGAYIDLYRAKIASAAAVPAESLAAEFGYRGREFALRNAARDCARIPLSVLRGSLELLAKADTQLKSSGVEERVVLEQTAAELIVLARTQRD